jgi:hypothetical protein
MVTFEVPGVVGAIFDVRADRAVSGVGALICDFFGVSIKSLFRLPDRLLVDSVDLVIECGVLAGLFPMMNGCRKAA